MNEYKVGFSYQQTSGAIKCRNTVKTLPFISVRSFYNHFIYWLAVVDLHVVKSGFPPGTIPLWLQLQTEHVVVLHIPAPGGWFYLDLGLIRPAI